MTLSIVKWASFDDVKNEDTVFLAGGFVSGHVWSEYMAHLDPVGDTRERLEVLRREIVRLKIKRGGDWHQSVGCPVFSDGKALAITMRAWGDFCAAVWNTHNRTAHVEPRDYCYMDFYMDGFGRGTDESTGLAA